jgi:hypothetical protein
MIDGRLVAATELAPTEDILAVDGNKLTYQGKRM